MCDALCVTKCSLHIRRLKLISSTFQCNEIDTCKSCLLVLPNSFGFCSFPSSVRCRHGCAVTKADKTVVQVMQQLQVRGQCSLCCKLFFSQAEIASHEDSTRHGVEINRSMQKAVLQHCRFSGTQQTGRESMAHKRGQPGYLESPTPVRNAREEFPAKRKKAGPSQDRSASSSSAAAVWRCECGRGFSEEAAARKHLFAANQIFHQCGVCGKHMEESSITRLHMSRFHGGAHLSNFLFCCRKCKIEMPRYEDILSHVSEEHRGHTYFTEQDMPEELAAILDAQPSTSGASSGHFSRASVKQEQSWMCRMCEDVFDSEEAVLKHCGDVSSHSFQRFVCGHCPQKFFKESTVRRHCVNEHSGQVESFHFCGLCDSMQFGSEEEFLEHYRSLHSRDYYCMTGDGVPQGAGRPTCPCMGSEKNKEELKSAYTRCVRDLAADGKCQYTCAPCGVLVPSYAQIKTHVHTKHPALNLEKTFEVACRACPESFGDVPGFHKHYHAQHCALAPCASSRSHAAQAEPTSVKTLQAAAIEDDGSGDPLSPSLRTDRRFIEALNRIFVVSEIDNDDDDTLVAFLNEDQANKDGNAHKGKEELRKTAVCLQADVRACSTTLSSDVGHDPVSIMAVLLRSVTGGASEAASLRSEEARESAGSLR